jgi:hypothetical protein
VVSAAIGFLDGRPPDQIGIVVADLDEGMARYSRLWGLGPWKGWEYGPRTVPRLGYRGGAGEYVLRLALVGKGPQVELIQSMRGPSIYEEFLGRSPAGGLHHLGFWVDSIDEATEQMAAAGYPPIQSGAGYGLDGDGAYTYFDTEGDLGVILEAVELVSRRREPDFTWP